MIHSCFLVLLLLSPPSTAESGETDEPSADEADRDASGGSGAVTPLPNYDDDDVRDAAPVTEPVVREPKKKDAGFQEPEDFGPFFEPAPTSEVHFPGDAIRPDRDKPFASVGGGMFCFVEDSACTVSLIADADVGVGLNIVEGGNGLDLPYTQFRVRGGLMLRPIKLARKKWHPWGLGVVASWSIGSGSVLADDEVTELEPLRTWRVALVNQLWLGQRRNALHVDFSLGGANSTVLDAEGRYWGTHVELALGFGGWAALVLSGDFLSQDSRFVLGVRGHGIATAPLIALVVLGLVAGGVAL